MKIKQYQTPTRDTFASITNSMMTLNPLYRNRKITRTWLPFATTTESLLMLLPTLSSLDFPFSQVKLSFTVSRTTWLIPRDWEKPPLSGVSDSRWEGPYIPANFVAYIYSCSFPSMPMKLTTHIQRLLVPGPVLFWQRNSFLDRRQNWNIYKPCQKYALVIILNKISILNILGKIRKKNKQVVSTHLICVYQGPWTCILSPTVAFCTQFFTVNLLGRWGSPHNPLPWKLYGRERGRRVFFF